MTIENEILNKISRNDSSFVSLNLHNSNISDSDVEELTLVLRENSHLTSLNLTNNHISDTGANALAVALKKNKTLISLDLQDNLISIDLLNSINTLINYNKESLFLISSILGDLEKIQHLLTKNISIQCADNEGMTALHKAAQYGQLEIVKYLIEHRISINSKNKYNQTAMDIAKHYNQKSILDYLSLLNLVDNSRQHLTVISAAHNALLQLSSSHNSSVSSTPLAVLELPADVLAYILNFNDHWNLINARLVCRSWRNKINFFAFNKLEKSHMILSEIDVVELENVCKENLHLFQTLLMSASLLKRLTLDQLTHIAYTSNKHAQMIFKSKIFNDNPIANLSFKKTSSSSEKLLIQETADNSTFFSDISLEDLCWPEESNCKINIFNRLLGKSVTAFLNAPNLNRNDLIKEELNKGERKFQDLRGNKHENRRVNDKFAITGKIICRTYIARSLAEKDPRLLQLAARHVNYAFNKNRLLELARISLPNTNVILLDECIALKKLDAEMMGKIASFSLDHRKMVAKYSLWLLYLLPLGIIRHSPKNTALVTTLLLQERFFNANESFFMKFQIENNIRFFRILQIIKFIKKETYLPFLVSKFITLSPSCAKAVLSVNGINPYIDIKLLKKMAQLNPHYKNLLQDFITENMNGDKNESNENYKFSF